MAVMRIAIGADHAGFELKEKIKQHLVGKGVAVHDHGTNSPESVDYPDYARVVGEEVAKGQADYGILVCGTGIGMSMAANKVPGIRAARVATELDAQLSREHNDANILTIGGRVLDENTAVKIVERWLNTPFSGGRHARRVEKMMAIERQEEVARSQ
jgi:ribose 5-phosphate isomerase B